MALAGNLDVVTPGSTRGPGTEVIDAWIGTDGQPHMNGEHKAKKGDRDVVIWEVKNKSAAAKNVIICQDPREKPAPLNCVGDPHAAKLQASFNLGEAASEKNTAYVVCTVEWPATGTLPKSHFRLFIGIASCPARKDDRVYELALEVVP